MASITYWSQLQPSPRVHSIAEGLAARVRDPAWLLCRQWQVGEFQGVDGGSPAFTRIGSHVARLESATLGESLVTLGDARLLEPLVEAEPLTPDLATRVELGQTFETLVSHELALLFRTAYPIAPAEPGIDPAGARFLAVCAGRAVDGVAIYEAAKTAYAAGDDLPAQPAVGGAMRPAAVDAVRAFVTWVEETWGAPGVDEPAAWDAARLDYAATVSAGGLKLAAVPDAEATLDWYAFDTVSGAAPNAEPSFTSVVPGHVRFRGMPNPRWWDFETNKTDFGAILADTRDLAKLLFADFMLLHGDDWFVARLDVPVGSLCWIDTLAVTDVFGVTNEVSRADALPGTRWTLFSTSDAAGGVSPFLVMPASAAAAMQESGAVEEVHLLRDETADMAWAIEHVVEGATGAPLLESPPPPEVPPTGVPASLAYELQSALPASWFPLLPVTATGGLALVAGTVEGGPRTPSGRIVQRLSRYGFQLPEREISRAGVRLERVVCRTRSADGGAHLWGARRRHIGAGEASSGLRFDEARAVAPEPPA
jgi:hypothetical protein